MTRLRLWRLRRLTRRLSGPRGGEAAGPVVDTWARVPFRLSYGEVYCPRCDMTFMGGESDPDARIAFRAHLSGPPHDRFTTWGTR